MGVLVFVYHGDLLDVYIFPRLSKIELILVLFVRLFDLRLFGFVCFLFLLVSGKGCGLYLWHSLDFSQTFFADASSEMGVSISVLRLDSGPRLKLVDSYPVVYTNDRSKAVVPVLLLLCVALWLIIRGNFTLSIVLRFILVFFQSF